MANTLITPQVIAREALRNLYASTVMAQLVYRDFDADFTGNQGDTISVRRPASFVANEFNRATGIVLQDATETSFPVTLDKLIDVSFGVTSEDLTLRVFDFRDQFIAPAVMAIVQKIEGYLLALATGAAVTQTTAVGTPADPTALVDAGKTLNDRNVPLTERYAVLTNGQSADMLKNPLFHQAQQRGDTQGLDEATIGRKFGFDIYSSSSLTADVGAAFHRTALALVTRTLARPDELPDSAVAVENVNGFGIRVVKAYDTTKKQSVVSLDMLVGTKVLDPNRITKLVAA